MQNVWAAIFFPGDPYISRTTVLDNYIEQYQVKERAFHDTVVIGDVLYLWAGRQEDLPRVHDSDKKKELTSNIEFYHVPSGQWSIKPTSGKPPLGMWGYSCSAVNDKIYYFGGYCGHDYCFHNSLNELDTVTAKWKELQPTNDYVPVMKRATGVITIEDDGIHCLLMIGGEGSPPTVELPDTEYVQLRSGIVRTNEQNMYNLFTGKYANQPAPPLLNVDSIQLTT